VLSAKCLEMARCLQRCNWEILSTSTRHTFSIAVGLFIPSSQQPIHTDVLSD
jgi:hypothetical protein